MNLGTKNEYPKMKQPPKPFFSFIVTIYNSEKYLSRCLSSISEQSFRDFEVIMVDDGSTDGSADVARRFASSDPRFHYYYQNNSGTSGATNTALSKLVGSYVINLDNDDYVANNLLSECVKIINDCNPDLIQFQSIFLNEEGNESRRESFLNDDVFLKSYRECCRGDKLMPGEFLRTHSRKVVRAEIANGLTFEGNSKGADGSFIRRVLFRCNRAYLSAKQLFFIRELAASESRKPDPPDLYKEWFDREMRDIDFCAEENRTLRREVPFWVFADIMDMWQMFAAKAILDNAYDRNYFSKAARIIWRKRRFVRKPSIREKFRFWIWLLYTEKLATKLAKRIRNPNYRV